MLLGLALSLFSCSQEDSSIVDSNKEKEVRTIDTAIGYESPYTYSTIHGQHTNGPFSYTLINSTDLYIEIVPFFSYGSFDEELNNSIYWPQTVRYKIMDLASSYYSPNLTANGYKYGNFVEAHPITLPPFFTRTINTSGPPVPFQTPEWPDTNNPNSFDFSGISNIVERGFLGKMGKLYFIKFIVSNSNGTTIADSTVKMNFPHNIHSEINPLPADWGEIGINDSYFNEQLIYNKITREICITITDESDFKDTYEFKHGNNKYEVGIKTTATEVNIYLKQI